MKTITQDIFLSLAQSWEAMLNSFSNHFNALEFEISISHPIQAAARSSDIDFGLFELRQLDRAMCSHKDAMRDIQGYLKDMVAPNDLDDGKSLDGIPSVFVKFYTFLHQEIVKPAEKLSEQTYRSMGIKDMQAQLELGASM